jgi:ABC-type methionine transport system permease subunit
LKQTAQCLTKTHSSKSLALTHTPSLQRPLLSSASRLLAAKSIGASAPVFHTTTQEITMTKTLIREAFWQSTQAFIEAAKNGVAYTDWHPVFGIL